jgi:hypothetical protein
MDIVLVTWTIVHGHRLSMANCPRNEQDPKMYRFIRKDLRYFQLIRKISRKHAKLMKFSGYVANFL